VRQLPSPADLLIVLASRKVFRIINLFDASFEFYAGLVFRRHQTVIGYVSQALKIRYTSGRAQKLLAFTVGYSAIHCSGQSAVELPSIGGLQS
jgi:hypothetical protein